MTGTGNDVFTGRDEAKDTDVREAVEDAEGCAVDGGQQPQQALTFDGGSATALGAAARLKGWRLDVAAAILVGMAWVLLWPVYALAGTVLPTPTIHTPAQLFMSGGAVALLHLTWSRAKSTIKWYREGR